MTEIERERDRVVYIYIYIVVDIQKKMSRRHEGVHKTELPQAPIASQRFLAVLTSQPRISRTLAIDRACDSGRQAPGSGNQAGDCLRYQYFERKGKCQANL